MDKSVYNLVDKRVGKFEDNSVDKQVDDQSAQMTWLNMWSNYLSHKHHFLNLLKPLTLHRYYNNWLKPALQGDSCIEVEPIQIAALAIWRCSSEIATTQVALVSMISRAWHYTDIGTWSNASHSRFVD